MLDICNKNILLLSPHCDDLEFSCFGTVNRLLKNNNIYVINFSYCEDSLPDQFSLNDIKNEFFSSMEFIGIKKENITNFNFPVRKFDTFRQEILEILVLFKKEKKIDIIFCPNSKDCHQDHNVIYNEAVRAFKDKTILGYDMPWNSVNFNNVITIELNKEDIEKKINCIMKYKSQYSKNKSNPDLFWGLAASRGIISNFKYAESFEPIRMVICV